LPLAGVAALFATVHAAIPADEIKSLPLFNKPVPAQSQYSGYLNITSAQGGKHMHYWYSKASTDDGSAPVIFWFNGGPGCSSMAGFLTEMGRYHFTAEVGAPVVVENQWTWSQLAHMVYIESPAGVGFSYADTPQGLVHNDTSTAEDNYATLMQFFKYYPELSQRDVWITGESYAGIYVPMLAQQVVRRGGMNLKGIAVGNGCTGTEVGGCSDNEGAGIDFAFLAGNHLISQATYSALLSSCNNFKGDPSLQCLNAQNEAYNTVGPVDIYDVYANCIAFDEAKAAELGVVPGKPRWHAPPSVVDRALVGDGPNACFNDNDTTTQYLNMPEVRQAIHVLPASAIGPWTECTDNIDYTPTMPDEITLVYPELISAGLDITIYNGNFDLCVPINGNEQWTSQFGSSVGGGVKEHWRPWLVDSQVQGYVTTYKGTSSGSKFRFVTVNAAGHMVPEFQPERSYRMIERILGKAQF
jgi:carboxypeptidase C (cathepsin A)